MGGCETGLRNAPAKPGLRRPPARYRDRKRGLLRKDEPCSKQAAGGKGFQTGRFHRRIGIEVFLKALVISGAKDVVEINPADSGEVVPIFVAAIDVESNDIATLHASGGAGDVTGPGTDTEMKGERLPTAVVVLGILNDFVFQFLMAVEFGVAGTRQTRPAYAYQTRLGIRGVVLFNPDARNALNRWWWWGWAHRQNQRRERKSQPYRLKNAFHHGILS
jgi:hypothetical protein